MKRRLFESIVQVYGCGWTAICQENTIAEIHHFLNKGLLTREEFAKKYDRFYGTDMANLSENQAIPVTGAVGQVIAYGVTPAPAVSEGER